MASLALAFLLAFEMAFTAASGAFSVPLQPVS
jgi:hypothetical protein